MTNNSITTQTLFDALDDKLLEAGESYITYKDVLEYVTNKKYDYSIKSHDLYNKLVNARKKVEKVLKSKGMYLEYANGKDCQEGFRYPAEAIDPMKEERSHSKKMRAKQIERLLKQSAGLFPSTWLADLLFRTNGTHDEQEPIILFGENLHLNRIELLPTFYDAVENQKVLKFKYNPGYRKEPVTLLFHTYRIKEYNQRWFIFGQSQSATGSGRNKKYNICALDRIVGDVTPSSADYIIPEKEMYGRQYFKDIVGVSRVGKKREHIIIECQDDETAGRIETKPMHDSCNPVSECEKPTFSIDVIPNKELYTQLLSYGPNIRVLSPESVVKEMKRRIEEMKDLYE